MPYLRCCDYKTRMLARSGCILQNVASILAQKEVHNQVQIVEETKN